MKGREDPAANIVVTGGRELTMNQASALATRSINAGWQTNESLHADKAAYLRGHEAVEEEEYKLPMIVAVSILIQTNITNILQKIGDVFRNTSLTFGLDPKISDQ